MTVTVTVNGEPHEFAAGTTVDQVVAVVTDLASGVAAAVNGEVVPRGAWPSWSLGEGDLIEVVTAVQGG